MAETAADRSLQRNWVRGPWWRTGLIGAIRALRAVGARGIARDARGRGALGILAYYHAGVLHTLRPLGAVMQNWSDNDYETSHVVLALCTGCNESMGDLLELGTHELHCCLKVLVKNGRTGGDAVRTWMRSDPQDGRSSSDNPDHPHFVAENTAWSALLGRQDSHRNWERQHDCFVCNDLTKHLSRYDNSRPNWSRFYRSTLVFPFRYYDYSGRNDGPTVFGFLAFDSPRTDVFGDAPDIFESDDWTEYHRRLVATPAYQLGSIMADTISMVLRPVYELGAEEVDSGS